MIQCGSVPQYDDALETFYSDGEQIHRIEVRQLVFDSEQSTLEERRNAKKVLCSSIRTGSCEFASFAEAPVLVHLRNDIIICCSPVVEEPFESL